MIFKVEKEAIDALKQFKAPRLNLLSSILFLSLIITLDYIYNAHNVVQYILLIIICVLFASFAILYFLYVIGVQNLGIVDLKEFKLQIQLTRNNILLRTLIWITVYVVYMLSVASS